MMLIIVVNIEHVLCTRPCAQNLHSVFMTTLGSFLMRRLILVKSFTQGHPAGKWYSHN